MEPTVAVLLLAMVAGLALRGLDSLVALFAGSLLAGCGIGLGNVLMPAILKRDFGGQRG